MSKKPYKSVEDSEDHEIFDINDFTTASDWERFIVQIEETINEWKLNSSNLNPNDDDLNKNVTFENGEWCEKSETIQFSDETFTITYFSLNCKKHLQPSEAIQQEKKEVPKKAYTYEETATIDFDSCSSMNPTSLNTKIENYNEFATCNIPPKSMADLLSKTNDFKANNFSNQIETPQIAYWYGLTQFVTISPTRENYAIEQESKANLILSSISIAINNSGCLIPIFVRVHSKQREMFIGICEGSFLKTQFQIIHFSYIPPQYSYLSGLLEIFKSKLGNHLSNSSLLITISVRFTYAIQENKFIDSLKMSSHNSPYSYMNEESRSNSLDFEYDDKEDYFSCIKALPFGSYQDCIDSIYLSCVWSNLSEDIIVDNDSYSDLNPQHSNDWSIILNNNLEKCQFNLTSALEKYINESKKTISVSQLLGTMNSSSSAPDLNEELKHASLKKLTSNRIDLSANLMETAANKIKLLNLNDPTSLPLNKRFLDYVMDYLFPDAELRLNSPVDEEKSEVDLHNKKIKEFLKKLNLTKSSSLDNTGLLNKLAIALCVVTELEGTKALAQIWKEFLLELRFRYEKSIIIPNLTTNRKSKLKKHDDEPEKLSQPDLSRCLLHQKLQMLNCCIQKRIDREKIETSSFKQTIESSNNPNNDEDDEEDEFFDCEDEESVKPDGRLKKFGTLTLLNKPSESLYVPVTQESTPMTEDMLEQHASVLVNLGSSDDAALLRAKIQSASLLSDMQSFKAANPECTLEDFVRWYSPRDWVEVQEKVVDSETNEEKTITKYELSNRMRVPDNIWVEVWSTAKSIPARKQKRLFDDTKEAENVFEWLNSLTINQIVEQTLPCLFYSAILTCFHESFKLDLTFILESSFDLMIEKAIKVTRNNSEPKKYQDLVGHIKPIEQITSLMKAIHKKFIENHQYLINPENEKVMKEFLTNLLNSSYASDNFEVKIQNGAHSMLGKLILSMFQKSKSKSKSNKKSLKNENETTGNNASNNDGENLNETELAFDKPLNREYILRASAPRPAPYSRQSPQRMYCSLANNEFRLAGAFTEDTLFY